MRCKVPVITTLSGAQAMVRAIRRVQTGRFEVRPLQELFAWSLALTLCSVYSVEVPAVGPAGGGSPK